MSTSTSPFNITALLVGMTGAASALLMYSLVITELTDSCRKDTVLEPPIIVRESSQPIAELSAEVVGVQLLVIERNGQGKPVPKAMRDALGCKASTCSVVATPPSMVVHPTSNGQVSVEDASGEGILEISTHVQPRDKTVELRLDAKYRSAADPDRGGMLMREGELRYRSCVLPGEPTLLGNLGGSHGAGPEVWVVLTRGWMGDIADQMQSWDVARGAH